MLKTIGKTDIGKRLGIGLGVVFLITAFFWIFSLIESKKIWKKTEQLYNHPFEVSNSVRDIKSNIIAMHRSMKDITLATNEEQITEIRKQVDKLEQANYKLFKTVFTLFLGNPTDIENAYTSFSEWKPIREEVIKLRLAGNIKEAAEITKGKGADQVELLMRQIQIIIDFANNKANETYIQAKESRSVSVRIQIILTVFSLILIVIILVYLTSRIKTQKKTEYALLESERILSTLMSNLPGMAYRCKNDSNWTMTFASNGCLELTGYEQEELLNNSGMAYADIIHPDDKKDIWEKVQYAIINKEAFKFQYRILTKQGEIKWVWEQGVGIYDQKGKLQSLEGFITDISERKNIEDILRESEEKHRSFLENSLEGLYIIIDGKMHFCNNKIAQIFGYKKAEDVLGVSILNLVHPDSREIVKEKIRLREEGVEKTVHYEYTGMKKDGTPILLETLGRQIFIKGKVAIQGAIRDITKQKESEELIRKLSRSVEQSPTSVLITDLTGRIEYVNPKFIDLTGYTLDEIRGRNPRVLKSGHTPDEVYKKIWQTITSGSEWKGELLNRKKNGELYWEAGIISPIKNNTGAITHFLGIKEDITDRKKIEEELIYAKEKAEESDKLKTSFLANMSHEIRTPMNAIMGFSGLLSDNTLSNEDRIEFIKLINNNSNNLLNLIDDIIDIAKIEAGQLKISLKDFDLIEILKELNATYQEINSKQNGQKVNLAWDQRESQKTIFINSDPHRIKQVLSNLIGNAIKYTETGNVSFGHKILEEINMKEGQKKIQFYVKDTGIGIPINRMNIIFDRFRQADDSHTRIFGGTGLGLAISKNIAQLLGGDIHAVSTIAKGSVFYFTMPLTESKRPESNLAQDTIDLDNIKWDKKTALIVEDVDSNFQLLKTLLKRTGINILWAKNGELAIKEVKNNKRINIILMDMQMPVLNGFEATKQIKKMTNSIPVIAVTAFALEGDRDKIIKSGCDDYISKPIKSIELYSKMSKFIL